MAVLVLPGIIWYGIKLVSPETVAGWDFDLGENRVKAEMPASITEEGYIQKIENYYNDHLPFRSILISEKQKLTGGLEAIYTGSIQGILSNLIYGKKEDTSMDIGGLLKDESQEEKESGPEITDEAEKVPEGHQYEAEVLVPATCLNEGTIEYTCRQCGDSYTETMPATGHNGEIIRVQEASYTTYGYTEYCCQTCGLIYRDNFEGKIIDNSYLAPVVVGEGVLLGRFDWLFYTGNGSISYFKGTNLLEEEKMAENLKLMEQLQELCDEKGIQLQFMIMPNKEQMYPEYMPTYEIADTYKRVDRFVDYVRENSDIHIIYPIRELKEAELYWQTYYRYDTHWNYVGAYIGTQALYKALGLETTDLHDVNMEKKDADVRGLITMGNLDDSRYAPDIDYIIDYKPEITVLSEKGNKMTAGIYYADTDSPNQKNFVMLADSFRCFMTDYLVKDFSHSVIAHRDYVDGLHESIQNADILVIAAVERYDNRIFPTVEKVIEILSEK